MMGADGRDTHRRQQRQISEAELRNALNFAAGEKVTSVPQRGVILGLIQAGLIVEERVVEERVGVAGLGRKLSLTPRGTVERIARMTT
jgi:hypothetical protein